MHELMALNKQCESYFNISGWQRWDYELDKGTLTFSDNGIPKVVASIVAVGTTSASSNTWLWAWANESIPHEASCPLSAVREFGDQERLSELTTDCWPNDEYLGWAMTAIAARILEAKGAYRCPDENGALYLLYMDLAFTG